jgi:uncharacterized protein YegP (UPF0339 family)
MFASESYKAKKSAIDAIESTKKNIGAPEIDEQSAA